MSKNVNVDVIKKDYQTDTTMGRVSQVTRELSRAFENPNVTVNVSDAMAAIYNSTILPVPGTKGSTKKAVKPWVKREKAARAATRGTKLRRKLLNLRTFEERNVEFRPEVPPKVGLRLERTMGTPILKLFDHKYMSKLSEKIRNADEEQIQDRIEKRRKVEVQRRRQLVIDGKAQPEPGEEDLLNHPVLRCKRVMERVGKVKDVEGPVVHGIPVPFQKKAKKLTLVEPFDKFERTGILFGEHKNHYLRVQRVRGDSAQPKSEDSQSTFHFPSFLAKGTSKKPPRSKQRSSYSLLDVHGKSHSSVSIQRSEEVPEQKAASTGTVPEKPTENVAEVPETGSAVNVETTSDVVPAGSQEVIDELIPLYDPDSDVSSQEEGTGTQETERVFGVSDRVVQELSMSELEKLYKRVRSKLMDEVFKENQELAASLFETSANVIQAYKRGQAKTDEFCKTSHRQAFNFDNTPKS